MVWGGPIDFDWVEIPAGEFIMGSKKGDGFDDERPQHTVHLPAFLAARVPVTNVQYKLFVDATGHETPRHWKNGQIPAKKDEHPVVNVSWHDSQAFCKWAGVLLPTEAQWEKAARGPDGRLWPWGNDKPTKDYCNFSMNIGDTTLVGSYLKGASPYGCWDMAGNVWEWTGSLWGKDRSKPDYGYPYDSGDGREDLAAPDSVRRVLRGGSFASNVDRLRCAYRDGLNPDYRNTFRGFRVLAPGF